MTSLQSSPHFPLTDAAKSRWPRLEASPNTERGQTHVRLVIALVLVAYGAALASGAGVWLGVEPTAELVATAWDFAGLYALQLLPAMLLSAWARRRPEPSAIRRSLALANDYVFIAAGLLLGGALALPLYAVLVSVTVGYGLRFGVRYLLVAVGCSYATIAAAMAGHAYGHEHPFLVLTMLLTVSLVPAYLVQLLRRLTSMTAQLVDASRAKDRFIATMNHELRNPLNSILGMSTLLQSTAQSPEQAQYTDCIHASAQSVASIVRDVLDLAAIEAGNIPLSTEDFNLHRLTGQLTVLHGPAAKSKGLELVVTVDPGTPAGFVGDPVRVSQILSNLVANAIKFTDGGRVDVVCSAQPLGPRAVLRIQVIDTGPGIADGDKRRIFEPFEQAVSPGARRQQGTGLGIPIARSLARAMGGELQVADNRPGGTIFTVHIPLPLSAAAGAGDPGLNVVSINDTFARHRRDVRPLRVMVVEDQEPNRILLDRLLHRAGHHVILEADPVAALERLSERDVDLVFVDRHMPELDGLEFLKQLRVMHAMHTYKTPVVVISGDSTTEAVRQALQAGASEFLPKPVHPARLLETVANFARTPGAAVTPQPRRAAVPIPNQVELLRAAGIDAAFIARYVDMARADLGIRAAEMRRAAFAGDVLRLQEQARIVAEIAGTVGAGEIAVLAATIGQQATAHGGARLLTLIGQLDHDISAHFSSAQAPLAAAPR